MNLYGSENNETIMKELGQRIQDLRIASELTQAEMAEKSGVALRTITRIENGENVKVDNILNVFRALGILPNLNYLIQEQTIAPTEMIDVGKKRKRVKYSEKRTTNTAWKWGDE